MLSGLIAEFSVLELQLELLTVQFDAIAATLMTSYW